MRQFNLETALQAKADLEVENELELWVINYLNGPANNTPFAEGLKQQKRYWRGPLEVPLSKLTRVCGPEADMPYRVKESDWLEKTDAIAQSFVDIKEFPPLIVSYKSTECKTLIVNDGNHRFKAFNSLGLEHCWVIQWYPDLEHYQVHEELNFVI